MSINKIKGTYDVLPKDIQLWQRLEDVIKNVSKIYNFKEIRTPIFEKSELFHRGVGEGTDIITKETYTFDDRGKRSVTLRPEGTAGVVRSYIENKLYANNQAVTKLYYTGPMFRYERPQKGRYRQFMQFGAEAFGSYSPLLDAEVIAYSTTILRAINLNNVIVKINSLGCNESKKNYTKALVDYFTPVIGDLCHDCNERLKTNPLRILDCKVDKDSPHFMNVPKMYDHLTEESKLHFDKVISYLDEMGINYEIDPMLVRGLDYYTETVFELVSMDDTLGAQNAVGGGGRYNNLVKDLDGPDIGACGFAFGLDRLILALENQELEKEYIHLFMMALGDNTKAKALSIVNRCRLGGLIVELDFLDKGMKGQFKQADKSNARYIAILGDDELQKGTINIKNQTTKEQVTINIDELYEYIVKDLTANSNSSCECSSCSENGGE